MPPLDEDDIKKVQEIVSTSLGLEEGKTLADSVGGIVNKTLNGYETKQKKIRETQDAAVVALTEKFGTIEEKIEAGAGGGGGGGGGGPTFNQDGQLDLDAMDDGPMKTLLQNNQREMAQLRKQQEAADKKANEAEEARIAAQAKQDASDLRSAVNKGVLNENSGLDAAAAEDITDLMISRGLVRKQENGEGFEMKTGVDEITNEPKYGPLVESLKAWGDDNKRWQPAAPGGGAPPPPGGGTPPPAGALDLSKDIPENMSPAAIREAAAKGIA